MNLALLQLPFMLLVYSSYYIVVDEDVIDDGSQKIAELGTTIVCCVMCFCMALLTYDDELILFY